MSHHQQASAAAEAAHRGQQRQQLAGMNAFDRHKKLMHDYLHYYGGKLPAPQQTVKTDYDTLKEQYRFIRSEEDDVGNTWEVRLAHKYYAKLFKEYAIVDLSRYKEGIYGMRWRTEKEVVAGRGQFSCGAKGCDLRQGLASFEIPFGYQEAGKQKQALVKVRLCPEHALQLNYRKNKEALKAQKHARREEEAQQERQRKRKKRESSSAAPQKPSAATSEAPQGLEEEVDRLRAVASAEAARDEAGVDGLEGQPMVLGSIGRTEDSQVGDLSAGRGGGRNCQRRNDVAKEAPEAVSKKALPPAILADGEKRSRGNNGQFPEGHTTGGAIPLDRRKGISKDDRWQMAGSSAEEQGKESSVIDDDVLFADLFL